MNVQIGRGWRILGAVLTIVSACFIPACASVPDDQRIDNFPMYGQPTVLRPDHLKKADEEFIEKAAAGLGGRKAASKAWASQAGEYMRNGDLHLAMRRYNQSWLLDSTNPQAYWGFGRIMLQRGKYEESLAHFEKAKQLMDDPYQKVALVADAGSVYAVWANKTAADQIQSKKQRFELAYGSFAESTALDASYAPAWFMWARTLYWEGKYAEAWDKVKKARSQDEKVVPPGFIKDLGAKMPEPR